MSFGFFDPYDERFDQLATESDAHAEWHRNSGVPMGTPGCPQDACHLDDQDEYDRYGFHAEADKLYLRADQVWAPFERVKHDPDDLPF